MAKASASEVTTPDVDDTELLQVEEQQSSQPTPLSVVDEYAGQGGSYLLDPETGIRTLVERTLPASL
jgi:hypothetical protein